MEAVATAGESGTRWPRHTGVGGLSLPSTQAGAEDRSPARALAALDAWVRGQTEIQSSEQFPFTEILAHYRGLGRTHVSDEVVDRLRDVYAQLPRSTPQQRRQLWPLTEWLPSTFDQQDGDYDSYLFAELLESLTVADDEATEDQLIDTVLVALAADLAKIESDVLDGGSTREQQARTRASMLVLSHLSDLAPKRTGTVPETADAGEIAEQLPQRFRMAMGLSMLPTTRLHDEQMFIRSIQLFESTYRQVYRCLTRAVAATQHRDVDEACAQLAEASARLEVSPVLYRVVTTMPKDIFAIIREYTDGRSAIQSRSYRQIELVCAPRTGALAAAKLPAVSVVEPSLQEAYVAVADQLTPSDAERLATAMTELDTRWRSMKRTHWGITLKIIGKVPGTGGTSGADYLKQAADLPLFPVLSKDAR